MVDKVIDKVGDKYVYVLDWIMKDICGDIRCCEVLWGLYMYYIYCVMQREYMS